MPVLLLGSLPLFQTSKLSLSLMKNHRPHFLNEITITVLDLHTLRIVLLRACVYVGGGGVVFSHTDMSCNELVFACNSGSLSTDPSFFSLPHSNFVTSPVTPCI
jgi:hypothetical protein